MLECAVDDEDLANAAHLLPRFLVAMDDRGVRMGALAVAEAAGALSLQEATLAQMRTGDSGVDRPWKWLTAVGREADRQGNGELVAQRYSRTSTHWRSRHCLGSTPTPSLSITPKV
ncbi:hypothetical protein [Streptomyces sp.]|uniref:hypothetical protein n=1 Tax=Streptomyces sp. TaxID=1931 RepID=UPI002D77C379|nr:hypothetical protein [Streptomyces sp.]HET6353185.1 hypothetical protein [Streptomyces sp.]